jgi:glycosyltransferase involved in cell wall biosynthesis
MRLLIISNMAHYLADGRVVGWGPAVREIDQLADAFGEVRHVAMLHSGPPPATALPYASGKVSLAPLPAAGGRGIGAKLGIAWRSPRYVTVCLKELRRADAVHVRCPANISLEALLLLGLLKQPKLRWVKYAGNWQPEGRDPFFYRLQRRWLERGMPKGLVTINGEWPGQPAHVVSFGNPCFTETELDSARAQTRGKELGSPVRLLFAGRLRPSKGAARALHILDELRSRGIKARLDIAGDGPEAARLERLAVKLGLGGNVEFHGWLSRSQLDELYRQVHFFLLPSSTEGWPKVLGEAMAFGAVPLAGAVSCIPQMLGRANAGIALPVDDTGAFAAEIERLVRNPDAWKRLADCGQAAASGFTYEAYVRRLCDVLEIRREGRAQPREALVTRPSQLATPNLSERKS